MSQLFDLSHPITPGMPVYPGDPAVQLRQVATVARDGCAVTELTLGSHTGTHLDAPSHFVPGAAAISEIDPGQLLCNAVVVGAADLLRGGSEHSPPQVAEAALCHRVRTAVAGAKNDITAVLFAFNWCRFWGTDRYFLHPELPLDVVRVLAELGITLFGTDTASPDVTNPAAVSAAGFNDDASCGALPALPVHDFWLRRNGLIIENLRGLNQLLRDDAVGSRVFGSSQEPTAKVVYGELIALPLSLAGCDGSPVRAVFLPR